MSEAKSCDHCGAGPDEPCPVGCTCGRDGDVSEAKHCRDRYLCQLHDCACPCDGCLPHSDPEAHENKTLRADVARLTRERDEAVAAAVEQRERYHALCGKFNELANSESNRALRAKVAELTRERDAARRELHRLTHGEDIEGDGVCRHEIDAQAARAERDEANARCSRQADEIARLRDVVRGYMASHDEKNVRLLHGLLARTAQDLAVSRRWSRLWHREARRLWREVQALSEHVEGDQ